VNSSINASGDVAAVLSFPTYYCDQALVIFRAGKQSVVDTSCNLNLSDRGLNDAGDIVYLNNSTLTISARGASPRSVIAPGQTLPGFGVLSSIDGIVSATIAGGALFMSGFLVGQRSHVSSAGDGDGTARQVTTILAMQPMDIERASSFLH